MKKWQKNKIDSIKAVVITKLWHICKCIRNENFLKKAAILVAKGMELEHIETIKDPTEREKEYEAWATDYENKEIVRFLLNNRRNYVITEIGDAYLLVLGGSTGKKTKDGQGSGEDGDEDEEPDEDPPLDLQNPNQLKCPEWLPTADNILKVALRDPEAWGYDQEGNLVDQAKSDMMDKMLAWYWDVAMSKCLGRTTWCVSKRCHGNMSTHRPNPSRRDRDPLPHVHASSEAVVVWMVENHYKRWRRRAMYNIKYPEKLKYKQPNGKYLEGLEDLEGKYTSPAGGRQPFGGVTQAGKERLIELTSMIASNREENAEFIKEVEDRVLKMVYSRNGRAAIDDKKKKKKEKKNSLMASAVEEQDEEECDMGDYHAW